MKILADENIPYVRDAFGTLGEVSVLSGRAMSRGNTRDTDILLVRSITKVNDGLLAESRVKFVATATIGIDHVDTSYLESRGIGFASAQGSNSNSVAEYVTAALLTLASRGKISPCSLTLGIVGVGNVGSKVAAKARAMGFNVLQNDPPLRRKTGSREFVPLDDLMEADVITLHVPLTREGQDRTFRFFDGKRMDMMKPGSILINSSRGQVVHGDALKEALSKGHLGGAVLDVWENEPSIDAELLEKADIATPHIAGYSFDGKVNGTEMIYDAACGYFGMEKKWRKKMPEPEIRDLKAESGGFDALRNTVKAVYDIEKDDCDLKKLAGLPEGSRGKYFDSLRRNYRRRREFFNTSVSCKNRETSAILEGLGFRVL